MTLRRQPRIRPAAGFAIRMAIMIGMIVFIVAFHWFERDSLRDNIDGHVSFSDVIYFTMISATTTGYGDVVPVTDQSRLFDALIVTPIRVFFLLLLAGTAYTFIIKRTWNRWLMKLIQKNLSDHILLAGFGISNDKALEELLAGGTDPNRVVVIDDDKEALDRAAECGVAVILGDAARDETLLAAHVDRAAALLISTGRDDSNILVVLTARKLSPEVKISVTIRETDNEVLVTAEMPGLEKKDFQLDLTADALTIRGEKRREHEEKGSVHRFERSHGAFERTIPLPCEVEADKASATYRNGVLDVTLPKAPSARRSVRRIEVRGE